MLTVTKEINIKGYELNNSENYLGVYVEPFLRLIEVVEHSTEVFSRPQGYHLRFRLADGVSIATLVDRLTKNYSRPGRGRKKENTFKPLFLWACESDPNYRFFDDDGVSRPGAGHHYHMAVLLDGRKASPTSLHALRTKLLKLGLVLDMAVIPTMTPEGKGYFKSLNSQLGREEYVFWLSYICKVRTKASLIGSGQRLWDSSRF
jgi:hypothetical protein